MSDAKSVVGDSRLAVSRRFSGDNIRMRAGVIGRWLAQSIAVSACITTASAHAETYPSQVIKLIVPFPAGGSADNVARMIVDGVSKRLGQTIIIENKSGASGVVGVRTVARAPADGYTLILGTNGTNGLYPFFVKELGYDPVKDFSSVAMLATYTNVLVVPATSPYQSVKQLIQDAKEKPGKLSFGTSGIGSSQYLAGLMFQSAAGVKLLHVPYRGGAQTVTDLVGGQISMVFETISTARPLIMDNRLRALGVTSISPSASLPGVRPISELGVPGLSMESYFAVFAPAGTPEDRVNRLAKELAEVVSLPEVQQKMRTAGMEPSGKGPTELVARQKADIAKWTALSREFDISPE